jgi:hypothetical protein
MDKTYLKYGSITNVDVDSEFDQLLGVDEEDE